MKYLILILILASILRLYGLNWDQYQHLHPDERMITMVVSKIHLPTTNHEWKNLLTPQSPLNPNFFAYGSFPIYLLKIAGEILKNIDPLFTSYEKINLLGRFLSVLFDLGTLIILYLLGKKILGQAVGLLAALFYAVSVLPIQLSHFYAVDTPLTFFIVSTLYLLIKFLEKPQIKIAVFVGVLTGLALATKISALVLLAPIFVVTILIILSHKLTVLKLFSFYFLLFLSIFITFLSLEPFALIDFPTFLRQTLEQQEMTKNVFNFPYTLQYVGKIPYWYEVKNIFLWGLGPILASIAFIGTVFITYKTIHPSPDSKLLTPVTFFWVYFAVVGSFAIGFMRYLLPLYPLLCLFAAIFLQQFMSPKLLKQLRLPSLILLLIWPLSFIHIYSQPNTRVQATNWINQYIPTGSILATEHWDDGLPLVGVQNYNISTLPLYDPESSSKWEAVNLVLAQSEYIIIASNRLYVPLQKLTNCQRLPPGRCYLQTADYYKKLFDGNLGFQKIAEFTNYPNLSIYGLGFTIYDDSADESFTVYDHPKVMIFQKTSQVGT